MTKLERWLKWAERVSEREKAPKEGMGGLRGRGHSACSHWAFAPAFSLCSVWLRLAVLGALGGAILLSICRLNRTNGSCTDTVRQDRRGDHA
jgi:hypothetical protein